MSASAGTQGELSPDEFLRTADSYRRELLAHCYKMVGSLPEAEDLVQETYVRAWKSWESFQARSSIRTWLYRIATNVCLTALQHNSRRILPSGLGAPEYEGSAESGELLWLDPFPDAFVGIGDPAEVVAARSGLRLALVASLQHLPARQRAVFLLREALGYPASDIADLLDMSVVAVKSALQRARATLDKVAPTPNDVLEPDSAEARAVLDRYMAAFESADIEAMTELLRADAVLAVVPTGTKYTGNVACLAFLADHVLTAPGLYRMFPTTANGQPAVVAYRRDDTAGSFQPFGIAVLTTDQDQIVGIETFIDAALVTRFGFPADCPFAS